MSQPTYKPRGKRRCQHCPRWTANRAGVCKRCLKKGHKPRQYRSDWNHQVRLALGRPPGVDIPRVVALGRGVTVQ